jgi:hypothetical protein
VVGVIFICKFLLDSCLNCCQEVGQNECRLCDAVWLLMCITKTYLFFNDRACHQSIIMNIQCICSLCLKFECLVNLTPSTFLAPQNINDAELSDTNDDRHEEMNLLDDMLSDH